MPTPPETTFKPVKLVTRPGERMRQHYARQDAPVSPVSWFLRL